MTRAARLLGAILMLSCMGFFLVAVRRSWGTLWGVEWNVAMCSGGLLALLFYLATHVLVMRTWQLLLCGLGSPVSFTTAARILLLSQFAKYLPGNVGQHLGRIVLAVRAGLAVRTVVASLVVETLTLVLVACACSLAAIRILPEIAGRHGARTSLAFGALLVVCIATGFAAIFIPRARRWTRSGLTQVSALLARGNRRVVFQVPLFQSLNFVLGALCLQTLASVLPGGASPAFVPLLGIYSSAWLLGFLAPGAPAGLGVREAVLLVGLTPLSRPESALLIAAALRIVTTVGDLLALLTGLALRAGGGPARLAAAGAGRHRLREGARHRAEARSVAARDGTMRSHHCTGG